VGNPRRRELLLKLAREWNEVADRLGVDAIDCAGVRIRRPPLLGITIILLINADLLDAAGIL